ncbi:hypothetical protein GGR28_002247 [Lewinella aquimaris]|uniref:Periplasmic heavy metal sensor n=1 Tax=Neolewinella aquimaris TaxID=1835722 RepID=A0A840E7B1_9BACT|nr:hypothetical protein [Neolewinella aquimaris]MBB4079622.1 hypothetical protein [Neolewinella aquimaris]
MDKLKVYQFAAIGLLLLNLALLTFIVLAPGRMSHGPLQAVKRFDFDAAQHDQFMTYAHAHDAKMRAFNQRQAALLETYFRQLTTPQATDPGPLPSELGTLELEKILTTYAHFLEVKDLLRPEQEEHFPAFVDAVLQQILLRKGDKRAGPSGGARGSDAD